MKLQEDYVSVRQKGGSIQDFISMVEDYITGLNAEIEILKSSKWIDVKDGQPEGNEKILTVLDGFVSADIKFINGKWSPVEPSHWQPLPEAE